MRYPTYPFQGQRRTLTEISRRASISTSVLQNRIVGKGMSVEAAIAMPVNTPPLYTYAGRTMNLSQWAAETGINAKTLSERIRQFGWPIERALTEPVINAADRNRLNRNKRLIRRMADAFQQTVEA